MIAYILILILTWFTSAPIWLKVVISLVAGLLVIVNAVIFGIRLFLSKEDEA